MRPARSPTEFVYGLLRPVVSLGVSVGLHLAVLSPVLIYSWLMSGPEIDSPGEEGQEEGPTGNDGGEVALGDLSPVNVSIYVEQPIEAVEPTPTREEVAPGPAPKPKAAAEPTPATTEGSEDGAAEVTEPSDARLQGVKGKKPRGNRKPCEPIEEIVATGERRWRVERDVVDFYAAHLKELEKQVGVSTHTDENGVPDGARLFLPRCSVLRQAGMKHADVVHTINGHRVATIPDAIAAYVILRNEENLVVEVTRKNGDKLTHRYRMRR